MSVTTKMGMCLGLSRPDGVKATDWLAHREAVFSDDLRYRYSLLIQERTGEGRIIVIMLNPSKADEMKDDPTVRRVRGFAVANGIREVQVLNLFAFRATDVKDMKAADDPVGPLNDAWLRAAALTMHVRIVVAWGTHGGFVNRDREARQLLGNRGVWCWGSNMDGSPKHPLYLPSTSKLTKWGT